MASCSVNSCRHNKKKDSCRYHRFPSDPKTCAAWVQVVGVEDFLHLNPEILHQKKFVCSCHFIVADYRSSLKMHIKLSSVPSVFDDKTTPISDEDMKKFLSPQIVVPTTSVFSPVRNFKKLVIVESQPPNAIKKESTDSDVMESHTTKRIRKSVKKESTDSDVMESPTTKRIRKSVKKESTDSNVMKSPTTKRIRKSAQKYTTKKKLIEDAGILGTEVTPETSAVLNLLAAERAKTKMLEGVISKLNKDYEILQRKLKNCRCDKDSSKRPELSLLAGLEQRRNLNRKSRGERYTREEILFATGLYKHSPMCYRFLMNYILLPSESTLKRTSLSEFKTGY